MQKLTPFPQKGPPKEAAARSIPLPPARALAPFGDKRAGGRERKNQGGNMKKNKNSAKDNAKKEEVKEAILKVALGYSVEEVTEEYDAREGELKLVKRKETKKDVPPDLKAAMLLMGKKDYRTLTDEELEREKERLIAQLKEEEDE